MPDEPSNTHPSASSESGRPTTPVLVQQQPVDEDLEENQQSKRRRLCTRVKSVAVVGDAGLISTHGTTLLRKHQVARKSHRKLDGNKWTQELDSMSGRKLDSIMALLVDSAALCPYQNEDMDKLFEDLEFVHDCNRGESLDRQAAIRARMEELEFYNKMNVYRKIKRKDAHAPGSKAHIDEMG